MTNDKNRRHTIVLTPRSPLEWNPWEEFLTSAEAASFYHSIRWLAALAEGMDQDIRVHVLTQNDAVCAGAVVRCARKFGVRMGRKPWATAYNGVVTASDNAERHECALRAELLRHYHHVRLVQAPAAATPPEAAQGAWRTGRSLTPYLDISDPDRLWESFDRHARQRVRKAEGLGVSADETNDYAVFHALYTSTYERQGLAMPLPREQIETTLRLAVQAGATKCYLARTAEGEPAAFLVVGFDVKRAYFVLAASDPQYRKTDAVSFLWWHVMKECAKTHREIDLVGVATPTIARFKASFSPVMREYLDSSAYAASPMGWAARCADKLPTLKTRLRGMLSRDKG